MAVSYKPLFKLMIDRNIRKGDIVRMSGVAYSTLGKMANGENVNMSVVEKICLALDCKIEDVVEILPEQSEKQQEQQRKPWEVEIEKFSK